MTVFCSAEENNMKPDLKDYTLKFKQAFGQKDCA